MSENHLNRTRGLDFNRLIMWTVFAAAYVSLFVFEPMSAHNEVMKAAPKTIIISAVLGLTLLLFPRQKKAPRPGAYPRLFRRFFAAHIDIVIAVTLMLSILFPVLLLVENAARDEWAWEWDTAVSPFYMPVFGITLLSCFIGVYLYFRLHLERGRATPGQYMMGYKIIPTGEPDYNRRFWTGTFYLWLWIIAWMARTETEGVYTWDKNSNSQAVFVE